MGNAAGAPHEKAIEYVRSGKLGNIRLVKVWAYQGWMKPVPVLPDSAPPEGGLCDVAVGAQSPLQSQPLSF